MKLWRVGSSSRRLRAWAWLTTQGYATCVRYAVYPTGRRTSVFTSISRLALRPGQHCKSSRRRVGIALSCLSSRWDAVQYSTRPHATRPHLPTCTPCGTDTPDRLPRRDSYSFARSGLGGSSDEGRQNGRCRWCFASISGITNNVAPILFCWVTRHITGRDIRYALALSQSPLLQVQAFMWRSLSESMRRGEPRVLLKFE